MEKQFVPYELALELKELGFDEKCLGYFDPLNKSLVIDYTYAVTNKHNWVIAPLWQQAFDWFEDKFIAYCTIDKVTLGSDEWEYSYSISYLPEANWDDKRRANSFKDYYSYSDNGSTYSGAWSDKIKVREECLKKLIEIINEENQVK